MQCSIKSEELYLKYEHLVKQTLNRKFSNHHRFAHMHGLEIDDLRQMGKLGLFKAVETYNPSKGTKFQTYAISMIQYYILNQAKRYSLRTRNTQTFDMVKIKSMESLVNADGEELMEFHETLGSPDEYNEYSEVELRLIMDQLSCVLPERTLNIVEMRVRGFTYDEIGKELGLTSQRIHQIVDKEKELICESILA